MSIDSRLKKLEALKKTSKEREYDFSAVSDEELNRMIELIEQGADESNAELMQIYGKVKII